jgi:hypothetical protein
MVAEGHAWAFRRHLTNRSLLEDERRAREAGVGLWSQPDPVPPWEWPQEQRNAGASQGADRECNIEGNIARDGERIYHVPGQKHFGRTRISTSKGERWFCSEREALEAGWRKARGDSGSVGSAVLTCRNRLARKYGGQLGHLALRMAREFVRHEVERRREID